jgi:hypothetical protein
VGRTTVENPAARHSEALRVSGPDNPPPQWLLEDRPPSEMKEKIEELRRQKERGFSVSRPLSANRGREKYKNWLISAKHFYLR